MDCGVSEAILSQSYDVHKAVCNNNKLLRDALDRVIDGVVITAPFLEDNPIVYVSQGFAKLTGYREEEIIGRNCRFLQGPDTDRHVVSLIRHSIDEARCFRGVLLNYRKNGDTFQNYIRIDPVFDETNNLGYLIGSQIDISHMAVDGL